MTCVDNHLQQQWRFRFANILLCALAALSLSAAAGAGQSDGAVPVGNASAAQNASASALTTSSPKAFSAAQLTEMQTRIDLANTITQNVSDDAAAKGVGETWRMNLLSDLYQLPSDRLRDIAAHATNLREARALASSVAKQTITPDSVKPKALGSSTDSLVFTPITPCRFIDTRNTGDPITSTASTFNEANAGTTYGGASGCVFPNTSSPGIAVNATVVVNGGPAGYIILRPTGSSQTTSFINWSTGGVPALANAGVIAAAPVSGSGYAFDAIASGGTTPQLIVDVFGYFAAATSSAARLDCQVANSGSMQLTANQTYSQIAYCLSGYSAVSAGCSNTPSGTVILQASSAYGDLQDNFAFCQWHNTAMSQSGYVFTYANCCRTAAQ